MVSDGVKIAFNVFGPTGRTVPAAGEYTNFPGTLDVALSWVELRAVP